MGVRRMYKSSSFKAKSQSGLPVTVESLSEFPERPLSQANSGIRVFKWPRRLPQFVCFLLQRLILVTTFRPPPCHTLDLHQPFAGKEAPLALLVIVGIKRQIS